jgi:hypothetical protein
MKPFQKLNEIFYKKALRNLHNILLKHYEKSVKTLQKNNENFSKSLLNL